MTKGKKKGRRLVTAAERKAILALLKKGWAQRRIAKKLRRSQATISDIKRAA